MLKLSSFRTPGRSVLGYAVAVLSITAAVISLALMHGDSQASAPAVLFLIVIVVASYVVWVTAKERNEAESLRRAHDELRRNNVTVSDSEHKLKEAVQLAKIGYWERDPIANRITWSGETYRIFGLQPRASAGLSQAELQEMIHPDDRKLREKALADALQGRRSYDVEYRVVRHDGEVRFVHVRDEIVYDDSGRPIRMFGIVQDITDRKRIEGALQQAKSNLELILDTSPLPITGTDAEGRITSWNKAAERLFVWAAGEVLGRLCRTVPSQDIGDYRQLIRKAMQGETFTGLVRFRQKKGGELLTCSLSLAPQRNEHGEPIGVTAIVEDITERKRAEAAAQENQQLLQLVLATLPVGVAVTDRKGDVFLTNAAATRIWGDPVIVSGRERWAESKGFWHDSGKRIAATEWASVRALSKGETSLNELIDIETYDRQQKTIQNSAAPIRNAEGVIVGAVIVNEDVTERVRAEGALRETAEYLQHLSRRLLTVQEAERRHLARELHDEFGQLLATVTVQLHAARSVAGDAARSILEACMALLQRAGEEVRSLALELRPAMLDTAGLDATLRWLATQHEQRTGVSTEVVGHLNEVSADVAIAAFRMVQEALTNVVRHARAQHIWIELSQADGTMQLVVRDDGVGFDVKKKLAQAAGRGHLGLLGMKERAQILGGSLEVDSEPGRGTLLRISLPVPEATPEPAEPVT